MIHITGDYYIRPDEYCYALCKRTSNKGEDAYNAVTYHDSIAGCIKAYTKIVLKERIKNGEDMELSDAVRLIEDLKKYYEARIEELTKGE